MKPFYTIDAGEFLVGSLIEKKLPRISLWHPTKDKGDDLLLMNRENGAFCTVQIKVSRDYVVTNMKEIFHPFLHCQGWFTPKRSKIESSISDYWILGLHSYSCSSLNLVIISPKELLRRYDAIHGQLDRLQSYFCLTKNNQVFETRGLNDKKFLNLLDGSTTSPDRDFTVFLNDWSGIHKKLKYPGSGAD